MSSQEHQVSKDDILTWLEKFHAASATLDADDWLDHFFTSDATLQYANNPTIQGEDVRAMFKTVFSRLEMMTHEVEYFDYLAPKIYQSARINYLIKGDDPKTDTITIPGFAVFYVRPDTNINGNNSDTTDHRRVNLKCYRAETYLDPSPVFQRIQQKFPQ